MFKSKQRIQSAWAKGLMFGKAVGKRDERDRIIALLEIKNELGYKLLDTESLIALIKGGKDD